VNVDLALGSPDAASVAGLSRAAESFGFDAFSLAETQHDPFVGASLALAATGRIQVGKGIAVAFARSPIVLAQTAFDLAALSGGRFQLGLGTQVRGHVERRFGMPWSAPAPRLEEWIATVRAAWAAWLPDLPRSGHHPGSRRVPPSERHRHRRGHR
jgi:alkanesulfonate monooxygenase SsuD/methylene tetrahydromethanopterin reductase-like flavin-dependent oxidoreductase (luciferase family)